MAPVLTAFLMVLFVPIETKVEFHATDILNAEKLTQKLNATTDDEHTTLKVSSATKHIIAATHRDRPIPMVSALNVLNELLNRADLFEEAAFAKVNLPREGLAYAERHKSGIKLSVLELRRFNRLLIEAAFPGEIRKLYGRGWRPVMIVYGLSGVFVAIAIWLVFRNCPEEH